MLRQFINNNPAMSNAEIVAAYNAIPPTARPGPIYVTYLAIGERPEFGNDAGNVAGSLRMGLEQWIAGPDLSAFDSRLPNVGQLLNLHDRLKGDLGADLTSVKTPGLLSLFVSGVPGVHAPLLTAEHAAALLAIGYVVSSTTLEQVQAERTAMAREARSLEWNALFNAGCALIESASSLPSIAQLRAIEV